MGRTFPGKGRLGWGGDKKGGIGVGEGNLGDVVPSVEPVRSHAGVNVAGPPTCKSNAGGGRKKVEECGDIRGGGRRVEVEDVRHFNVILLLNSITEMWGGVVGVPGRRSSGVPVPPGRRCEDWKRGLTGDKTWWGATAGWWVGWMDGWMDGCLKIQSQLLMQ